MQGSEFRRFPRRTVSEHAEGQIFAKEKLGALSARFLDVSSNGLGLQLQEALPVGTELTLICGQETIALEVIWVKPMEGNKFRCGVRLVKPAFDLEEYFVD